MSIDRKTILIQALAPAKPDWGAPCNGCGICCLAEPCPVGMVLSRKRQGACDALHWEPAQARYRCGAIVQPEQVLRDVLPAPIRMLSPALAPLLAWMARRTIAVGSGCDCDLQVVGSDNLTHAGPTSDPA
jgi:hypothetical protein